MEIAHLLQMIRTGETSRLQFKQQLTHDDALAAEIVAMSNSLGGMILLGVKDRTGEIIGIDLQQDTNERISNIASTKIIPPVYVQTEVVSVENDGQCKDVLIIHVPSGGNKPYKTNAGIFWIKQGADKRKLTDNFELMRLFQASNLLTADEMPIEAGMEEVDESKFRAFFQKEFTQTIEEFGLTYPKALEVKRVIRNSQLTLAGLLFFGKNPQIFRSAFCIKAVAFYGNDLAGMAYRDSQDILGSARDLFDGGMAFFKRNLRYIQQSQDFNSQGILEISEIALQELLVNAIIHRDYYKNSPIRLLIFDNRIEIISPGKLPNSLTTEDIKYGNPVVRNNLIVSYAIHTLPFRGLGSGIRRALGQQPNIELINDEQSEQFVVMIPRG